MWVKKYKQLAHSQADHKEQNSPYPTCTAIAPVTVITVSALLFQIHSGFNSTPATLSSPSFTLQFPSLLTIFKEEETEESFFHY